MAIYYDVIKRKSPKDGTVKFYSQAKTMNYVTIEQLARRISGECTVTYSDILAVLKALEVDLPEYLLAGNSVRLGTLGSFHITMASSGAESKKEFTTANINRVRVRFVPTKALQDNFAKGSRLMTFRQVKDQGVSGGGTSGGGSESGGGNTGGDVNPNA